MKRKLLSILLVCLYSWMTTSCTDTILYSHYEHLPVGGWERMERIYFSVPAVDHSMTAQLGMGLRVTADYPFMALSLIVEQQVLPSGKSYVDTLNCELMGKDGIRKSAGVSLYQYNFPVSKLMLHKGDSVSVCIRHNMKREILPGISDIGLSVREE